MSKKENRNPYRCPRNGPSGKKPQSCTMKRTDRNIWKCRSGIPDIIMISTAWLQHRLKKLLFSQAGSPEESCRFQNEFYPRSWAKYPEAVPGTLKLLPPEYRFAALEADYNSMQDMLYGDVPTFETVIAAVQELEKEINTL